MKHLVKLLLFSLVLLLSLPGIPQVSFHRVDPPFWWAGMEDTTLQLMFYGNKIAESNVIVNYPGVVVKNTKRVENPNYIILDLEEVSKV